MTPLHVQFCPCSLKITPLYVHATKTDPPQSPHLIPDGFKNVSENPTQNPAQKVGRRPVIGMLLASKKDHHLTIKVVWLIFLAAG